MRGGRSQGYAAASTLHSTNAWANAYETFPPARTSMLDGCFNFTIQVLQLSHKIRLLPLLRCMSYIPAGGW